MLNFNVKPYWDDFDETKNYHRVLFKPGFAVQARELTQSQTILQNQITKFADHIFVQNSPVSGGKLTVNQKCYYLKLQDTYNDVNIDVNEFDGLLVKNTNGSVLARVIAVADATGGDPPTLILSYLSGPKFGDGDTVYDIESNLAVTAITTASTGLSSTAHITQGVFYVLGNFVTNTDKTVVLSKYSDAPSARVGLNITETIHDYIDDASLLDPAVGASNYQAPGADRYVIDLNLETRPLTFGDDGTFIELLRIENGQILRKVDGSVYATIDDYFAKRTYDTNGDYVVSDFALLPKPNSADDTKYDMTIGKGVAYVHGYRVENQMPLALTSDRARTTVSQNNVPIFMDYGNYLYVNQLRGANSSVLDVSTTQAIDLHCVSVTNINTTNTSTYNATVVSSGYIRGLGFDHYTSQSDANTYVYKAFVNDLQNATLTANALGGAASTITLPGTYSTTSNAYLGVDISITAGPAAGDFRTITSYNGTTRVATVNSPWSTTPNTSSVFALNFAVKDAETLVSANAAHYILSTANLSSDGRAGGVATGDPSIQNPNVPEMLFKVGMPYVATLADSSYTASQVFRSITFTPSGSNLVAQLPFGGDYSNVMRHLGTGGTTLSSDVVSQNFLVIVTSKGSSSYNVGDQLPWTINSRTVTLNADASIATLTGTSADLGGTFTATVIVKAFVSNADNTGHILRLKNLITANTQKVISSSNTAVGSGTYTYIDDAALTSSGQVYIQNAGLVSPGSKQSLYVSDVKKIIKIIDTKDANNTPNVAMLTDSSYDVTRNFIFDNGQRDSFYDHASVKLKVGATKIQGNMLVLMDYYQHTGGDGYFSVESYLNSSSPEEYRQIGSYTSSNGNKYELKDSLDFRPTRQNGTYSFAFRYSNPGDTSRYGTILPIDLSTFTTDYEFYLARKDKLVLTKDRSFQIIQGAPAVNPIYPPQPDNSLLLANLSLEPYTGYVTTESPVGVKPNISLEKVKHKRYTMQDIAGIDQRVNNLEYYTSLNLLEQQTQTLQITDAYGLNRFKNGIVVDNFSGFLTADTASDDFLASINRREKKMEPMHLVKNFPLKSLDMVVTAGGNFSTSTSLTYSTDKDGFNSLFSLPYTTANVASQKIASRSFNLNPFSVVTRKGTASATGSSTTIVYVTNVTNVTNVSYSNTTYVTTPAPNPPVVTPKPDDPVVNIDIFVGEDCYDDGYWADMSIGGEGSGHSDVWVAHTTCIPKTPVTTGDWKTVGTGTQVPTPTTPVSSVTGNLENDNNGYDLIDDYYFDPFYTTRMPRRSISVGSEGLLINTEVKPYLNNEDVSNSFLKTHVINVGNISTTVKDFEVGDSVYNVDTSTPIGTIVAVEPSLVDDTYNIHISGGCDGSYASRYIGSIITGGFDIPANPDAPPPVIPDEEWSRADINSTVTPSGPIETDASSSTDIVCRYPLPDDVVGQIIYCVDGPGAGQSATIIAANTVTNTLTLDTDMTVKAGLDLVSIGPLVTSPQGSVYGTFCVPTATYTPGVLTLRDEPTDELSTTSASTTIYNPQEIVNRATLGTKAAAPSGDSYFIVANQDVPNTVGMDGSWGDSNNGLA